MNENNFTCAVSQNPSNPDEVTATVLWHLYSGEKMPLANIINCSEYGGDHCCTTVNFQGGFLTCEAWCDHITGSGALPIKDETGKTFAVLHHNHSRWSLEAENEFYPIGITEDPVTKEKTILVYDPVPEKKGDVLCYYPLAYIEDPKRGESYSGLVNRQLPTKLCMALVWLPFIMGYALVAY